MEPAHKPEVLQIRLREDGFYFERGQPNPNKAVETLKLIKTILEHNLPYSKSKINEQRKIIRMGNVPNEPAAPDSQHVGLELIKLARLEKEKYLNHLDSASITAKAWTFIKGEQREIESLANNIQELVAKYKPSTTFQSGSIKIAREMGWKGLDEDATEFLNDFKSTFKDLIEQKIITDSDVIRTEDNEIDILKTFRKLQSTIAHDSDLVRNAKGDIDIEKSYKLPRSAIYYKRPELRELARNYIENDKVHQAVQLVLLFKEIPGELFSLASERNSVNCMPELAVYCSTDYKFTSHLLSDQKYKSTILELIDRGQINLETVVERAYQATSNEEVNNFWIPLLDKVKETGFDLKTFIKKDPSRIHQAIKNKQLAWLKYLIKIGLNIDRENYWGQKPIHTAIEENADATFIEELIKSGADIFVIDRTTREPLILSHKVLTNESYVDALLNSGLYLGNLKNGHGGILNNAVAYEVSSSILLKLLRKGFDVNEKSGFLPRRPLGIALQKNHYENVKILIEAGATFNKDVLTQLDYTNVSSLLIPLLIKHGADVNSLYNGHSALVFAAAYGRTDIVECLLSAGANPNNPKATTSALNHAIGKNDIKAVQMLIDHGANVNASVGSSALPLFFALNNPVMVKLLLDHGADLNLTDPKNKITAFEAARRHHPEVIAILEEYQKKKLI